MFARLPELLAEAAALPGIRALVLRGAGTQGVLRRGGHLRVRDHPDDAASRPPPTTTPCWRPKRPSPPSPRRPSPPCTATATAAAARLALACDLRFAAAGARFAITPAKLGIVYPLRATKRLVDLVGPSRAKFILMSGRGLQRRPGASRVRPGRRGVRRPGRLDAGVRDFTALLAARSGVTQRAVKQTVARILDGATARRRRARRAARGRPRQPRLRRGRPRLPRAPPARSSADPFRRSQDHDDPERQRLPLPRSPDCGTAARRSR